MDKMLLKDDIKGLEDEIDSAIDRLFVDGKNGQEKNMSVKPPLTEGSFPSFLRPIEPISFLKSIEKMESKLLSLEWEISNQTLRETIEEIFPLKEIFKEESEIISVLNIMEKVLNDMMEDAENIRSTQIKFLMDSMETIKLLTNKNKNEDIDKYKRLAFAGIEARFFCLEKVKNHDAIPTLLSLNGSNDQAPSRENGKNQIEDMLNEMNLLAKKNEVTFQETDQHSARSVQTGATRLDQLSESDSQAIDITIFKIGEIMFGVESDKIFKLFKIPSSFYDKYPNPNIIRLKDLEVKMIDFKKILLIQGEDPKEEIKILTVKDNGGYKGWRVAKVHKRLSFHPDHGGAKLGEYFTSMIHWTYQGHSIEIPIINLNKFK